MRLGTAGGGSGVSRYYGKYRGSVVDAKDPDGRGRLKAFVPDVLGEYESGWAEAAVPFAGQGVGFLALPDVGSSVWIEFAQGDPDYPIWSGCFWPKKSDAPVADSQNPSSAAQPGQIILRTTGGMQLVLDDQGGKITVQSANGQKIVISGNGIEIDDGQGAKVSLSGPKVAINDGALEVI